MSLTGLAAPLAPSHGTVSVAASGSGLEPSSRSLTARRGPGRPRDEELDERLRAATLALIDAEEEVTVSKVLAESGVSRAGLYRRWPSLATLIAAALDTGRVMPPDLPETGNLRELVVESMFGDPILTASDRAVEARMRQRIRLVMADRELQRTYWEGHVSRRRVPLERALAAAVARGELRTDLDPAAAFDAIAGVAYYQIVVRGESLREPEVQERVRTALELVWRGMLA
ncbi:TetR family transcriptional regulator [Leucobacter luti]|uniref:TetR family transcriptional regulator n=1 Tax=Leucobacter luti TaxID=340320 RepID=A0A4R6RSP6_9MICO|nr:TetR-like C-terminal domain-containing protein [Leucobacter luti]TDP89307.1 TetR family transcriptional regulator [Leucobacter luti]